MFLITRILIIFNWQQLVPVVPDCCSIIVKFQEFFLKNIKPIFVLNIFRHTNMQQPLNEHPVLILSKDDNQIFDYYARRACKILKFTPEWKINEILSEISKMEPKIYPSLYIFIIGHENFELAVFNGDEKKVKLDIGAFENNLKNFRCKRSIYLQLTSINEDKSKFYCRYENFEEFYEMDSEDFVNEVDDHLLSLMVENGKVSDDSQTIVEEIYENFLKTHLESRDLVKTDECVSNPTSTVDELWTLYYGKADDEVGLSTSLMNDKSKESYKIEPKFGILYSRGAGHADTVDEDARNQKFVLFSNKLSSSSIFHHKIFTSKLREKQGMWTSYINLKQSSDKIKKQNSETDFPTFMAEKILNKKTTFESEIFKKLYKNGKVNILIVGFDEVDLGCIKFVAEFCRKFKQNGGNQLWMAVEDVFEDFYILFNLNDFVEKCSANLTLSALDQLKMEVAKHKSGEFNNKIWEIIQEHFLASEVKDMIKSNDNLLQNYLLVDVTDRTNEVMEIKLQKTIGNESELINYFEHINDESETILHVLIKNCRLDNLKYIWKQLQHLLATSEKFKKFLNQKTLEKGENLLHIAAKSDCIKIHEALWDLLSKTFGDRQELMDFIMHKSKSDDNFIHCVILHGNPAITELTLTKIKEVFNFDQHQVIVMSSGQFDRHFLQLAAIGFKDVNVYNILWSLLEESRESYDQFLDFILKNDKNGQNIIHLAAGYSTIEIFRFITRKLGKLIACDEFKNILCKSDTDGRNLLQTAAKQNKCLKFHENLWHTTQSGYEASDFWKVLEHVDEFGDNVLCTAVQFNTTEVVKFIWSQIRNFMIRKDFQFLYSNVNKFSARNWIQISLDSNPDVFDYCEEMQKEYEFILSAVKYEQSIDFVEIL